MTNTIFLIHGMFAGPWVWDGYKAFFEQKKYRCITPTLRFHDNLTRTPDPQLGTTSLLDYAQDLESEIRKLESSPIIIGHSMGGLLAQILASRGLAHKIILLAPAPPAGILPWRLSVARSSWSVQTTWAFWRKPIRLTFAETVYSSLHLLDPAKRQEIYKRFVYDSGKAAFEMCYWPFDPKRNSQVDESKVTCPVLVIGGVQDRLTPVSIVRQVARKYKTVATYKEFSNHAHWILGEPDWEGVAEYAADWLK